MTGFDMFIAIATNFFTGCVQELASKFDEKIAASGIDADSWRRRSRGLDARMVAILSAIPRHLDYNSRTLDILRAILSDQVFIAETVKALIDGTLQPALFAQGLARRDPSLESAPGLSKLAAALIEGFDAAIASDPELTALVGLRRSEDLKRDVQNVAGTVGEIGRGVIDLQVHAARQSGNTAEMRREMQQMRAALDQFAPQSMKPSPFESPAGERLAASTKRRFDGALASLKAGSAVAAAQEFKSLLVDLVDVEDPDQKNLLFRTTANLGIALHYIGDRAGAAEQFERAFRLNPDSTRAKANRILAALTSKDYATAELLLSEALASSPNDPDLINFKAQLLADQGNVDGAVAFLEDRPRADESYHLALAIHYNQAGSYEKAFDAARNALDLNPQSDSAMAVLADAIAMPIVFRKAELKLPAFAVSPTEADTLREAVRLSEQALTILRPSEHKVAIAQVLINLSAYSAATGDFLRAAVAAEEAVGLSPDQPAALTNLYIAQMHLDRFDDAVETARRLARLENPVVAAMREMDALIGKDDFAAVIELYQERSATNPDLLNEPHAACAFADALFKTFETDRAVEELRGAADRFPNHPLILLQEGHIREELNDPAAAEACFKAATAQADGAYAFHARQQLGLFYWRKQNWHEAEKNLLGGMQDPLVSPLLGQYLVCLYQLGRYRECLDLSLRFISREAFDERIWELAANCHLQFSDLHAAEGLLEELVRHSAKLRHWLKLFEVTYRLHNVQRARKVLQRAHAKYPDSYAVNVNLSGVEFTMGHYRRAFDLALRAVELSPNDPEGHRAVMRCALLGPVSQEFSAQEKERIQISIAQLAGQEGSGVRPLKLQQGFSNLKELMRQVSESAGEAEDLFSSKGLPMAFLTRALGRSLFTIWRGLTVHHRLFVPMALGSQEEQDSERELAIRSREIVIDTSALFTLMMLKRLELLPKFFDRVFVATAVFESIKTEVDELTAFKAPESVLGYANGGLVMADIPIAAHEAKREFLVGLLDFLKSDAVRLSGIEGTVWEDPDIRKTMDNLGDSGSSIAVAKGRNIPLYSDDVGVRSIAKTEHEVQGFCTQAFLRAAVANRHIDRISYEDALIELFRHNYNFVSEGAETVIRALEKERFAVTPFAERLVSRITDPVINSISSATILGTVVGSIWLNTGSELRETWLEITARNLAGTGSFGDVCSAFLRTLAPALIRIPAAFFGASRTIGMSRHLSPQQKGIWRAIAHLTARATAAACAKLYPAEVRLNTEWLEHIRIASIIDHSQ
jgi:tetratricopeptide (TPR) repeat protein/predicted nucleic acid-binding protein